MAEERETQAEDWGAGLPLEGRYLLYPDKALPAFNAAGGAAYAARHKNDAMQALMGIISSGGVLPRIENVRAMKMIDSPCILRLCEGGVVHWPAQNTNYYALIYERPLAERYWKSLNETHPVMSEDTVNNAFVIPMIKALLEFQRTGLVHGGIRPTNIFWRDGSTTPPQIGDGLSAPCGVGQPSLFEPIERALCQPIARGEGNHADDCYAFGMTLAFVVLGTNPFQGIDDQAALRLKLDKGSFTATLGTRRLPPAHIELLRGLLSDDPRQRWTAEDLEQWMTGRRATPKSSDAGRRASRHFSIAGKEYWQLRPLAAGMAENVAEAVKVIENGSLEKWITRSLGDEERAKSVAEVVEEIKEKGKTTSYQDQLVARVCIALDPVSPIRYRGLSVMPQGIATVLAEAIMTGQNLQILSEILTSRFVTLWVNMQKDVKTDFVPLAQQLERMAAYAEKTSFGSGLERVLYEMNSGAPCLSPLFKNDFILSPKQILSSLERMVASGARSSEPMDRHLAAFLIAREKRSESLFTAMGPTESSLKRGLALISLFGEMQNRYGPDKLPQLCAWLMPLVEPCLRRFLSKPLQDKVRRQAKEAVDQGSLSLLLKRVDDSARVMGDENDFLSARAMYRNIQKEMAMIEKNISNKNQVAREMGRPVSASVASLLALILIAVTLWKTVWQGLMG
ncbi:MAG: hypothetical protein WC612_00545 [Bdellovibrionales bacterium]|jgi:hypothetical protein